MLPAIKRQRSGAIVNLSSIVGRAGAVTVTSHYAAAKAAILGFTRHLAREVARDGIRVCAVQPGFTLTPGAERSMAVQGIDLDTFTAMAAAGLPMGAGQPAQIAEGFLFLASDYASYITAFTLLVDGGSYASHFGRMLP